MNSYRAHPYVNTTNSNASSHYLNIAGDNTQAQRNNGNQINNSRYEQDETRTGEINYGPWMMVKPKYKKIQNMSHGKLKLDNQKNPNVNSFHILTKIGTHREPKKLKRKSRKETNRGES